ncbi:MAG: hypothetical protein RR553_07910, partial [Akkermansia sp.]
MSTNQSTLIQVSFTEYPLLNQQLYYLFLRRRNKSPPRATTLNSTVEGSGTLLSFCGGLGAGGRTCCVNGAKQSAASGSHPGPYLILNGEFVGEKITVHFGGFHVFYQGQSNRDET